METTKHLCRGAVNPARGRQCGEGVVGPRLDGACGRCGQARLRTAMQHLRASQYAARESMASLVASRHGRDEGEGAGAGR